MTRALDRIALPDAAGLRRAVGLLRAGSVVAFPTETVYGLGADAFSERAVCPYCDGPLVRRSDDDASVLLTRLSEFNSKTQPLADFYEAIGVLRKINGNREREAVFAEISHLIEQQST